MNEKNLKPNTERTPKQRKELARKAGIASGEARRAARSMKEWAKIYGNVDSTIKMPDGSSEMTTMNGRVVLSMYKKALDGSTKAAEFLAKLLGEYNINITMDEAKEVRPEINIE